MRFVSRANLLGSMFVLLLVLTALVLDLQYASAGLLAALILSASTGVAHGAADAWLLMRFVTQQRPVRLAVALLAYLLAVLLVAAALLWIANAALALALLIALSLWHFGEGYADDVNLPPNQVLLLRMARGAAPIAAPLLASYAALQALLLGTFGAQTDVALLAFKASLVLWLGALLLLLVLAIKLAKDRNNIDSIMRVFAECAAVLALNAVLSPLMAFALYFGVFHALTHLQRLHRLSERSTAGNVPSLGSFTLLATGATLLLTAALYAVLARDSAIAWQAVSVQTLVIALCALTAPHVVLISRLAKRLV
jgi:beta-carotene 15,15'-dioxygenase